MFEAWNNLFTSGPFIPHGHCYLWRPGLVGFHLISDLSIALAYYSIPTTLIYLVRKRSDLPYPWVFLLFGAFIIACGTTHLMEVWTLWHPTYWLSGLVKIVTAIISLYTAATLIPLIPHALALPNPSQLEAINRELAHEITERKQAQAALKQANDELEIRVGQRTAELLQANEKLYIEVAEREQAQESLRQSEAQNRAILAAIPDLLLRVKSDGSCLDCRYPKDLEAVVFMPIDGHLCEVLPPELLQRQLQYVEQALTTDELQVYEHQLLKQGSMAYEELRITAISEDEVLVMVRDITARKQAEEALRESENQLRLITDALPVLVSYVDTQQCYRFNNRAYEQWFGHERREITGQSIQQILGESAYRSIEPYINMALAGQSVTFESRIPYQNGGTRYVQATYLPHFGEYREVRGYVALVSDITERKQLEENLRQTKEALEERVQERTKQLLQAIEALQQSEVRYRAIVEDQTELITRFGLDGILTFVNEAYCRYFGVSREDLIGNRYEPIIFEADREQVTRLVNTMSLTNPSVTIENRVIVEGQIRWTQWVNRIISDDRGQFLEFQSVGRDITDLQKAYEELELRVRERTLDLAQANQELQIEIGERKRAEEQIKASLREKEVLLQEIHHRVKNNLQVICSLLNLQSRKIKDRAALDILKDSQNRVRSMALIHEKLYQSENLSSINFSEYIRYLASNLFRSYGVDSNTIALKIEISPRILLDVDEALNCGLIVNELISNSLKYAFPQERAGEISVKIQFTEEQGLVMLIGDNGIGLPANFDLENAETLGLKLVNSWIAQLRGTVQINPTSQGTEFKISFPSLK